MNNTLYHGAHKGYFASHVGLCLTDDHGAARTYATLGGAGVIATIELDLSEWTVVDVEGYSHDENTAAGDDRDQLDTFAEAGADLIRFNDEDEWGHEHTTYRVVSERLAEHLDAMDDADEDNEMIEEVTR
jgi:hypothetical protein